MNLFILTKCGCPIWRQYYSHYKSGDIVKVIDGEFKGVTGRVARIAGQQRVVVEISGLCLVATAYIPTDFIKFIK